VFPIRRAPSDRGAGRSAKRRPRDSATSASSSSGRTSAASASPVRTCASSPESSGSAPAPSTATRTSKSLHLARSTVPGRTSSTHTCPTCWGAGTKAVATASGSCGRSAREAIQTASGRSSASRESCGARRRPANAWQKAVEGKEVSQSSFYRCLKTLGREHVHRDEQGHYHPLS
jgi:hypothetical protein